MAGTSNAPLAGSLRALLLAAALAGAILLTSLLTPSFAEARSCNVSRSDYPGNGYFLSLSTTGVSCAKGKRVARAHYRCRTANGRDGRCGRRVKRFRCTERRGDRLSTEYTSRVTCRRGSRRVRFVYQQNL